MTTTGTAGGTGLDDSGGGSTGATAGSSGSSESGSAPASGGFEPGVACPDVYAPVCGKDGETYDNACDAGAAGVEIRREGPCVGDCEGSCVVAPRGASLLGLALLVLAFVRRRPRAAGPPASASATSRAWSR